MKKILNFLLVLVMLFSFNLFGCNINRELTFYAPDGAPALSIAELIADREDFDTDRIVNYNIVSSEEIGTYIKSGIADFIILPLNLASTSYKTSDAKDHYKMVAVITHGNLYLSSKTEITDINQLKGQTVGIAGGENLVPDLTLKAILKENGIAYQRVENGASPEADKVGLLYANPQTVKTSLKEDKIFAGLLPEPAISMGNTASYNRLSIQELYDAQSKSFPQAVLMVKKSLLKRDRELVEELREEISEASGYAVQNSAQAIANIKEVYPKSTLAPAMTGDMISRCNIYWQSASSAKTQVQEYLRRIQEVASVGVGISVAEQVTDEFFA